MDQAVSEPSRYDPSLRKTREELAAAYRICYELGINRFPYNHLTVDCGGGRFLVNRYGLSWSEVTADNLLLITNKGELLEGEPPVMQAAFVIHEAIHSAKGQKARVVFHTHQTAATALACTEGAPMLPPVTPSAVAFRAEHAIIDDSVYVGIANDAEEGQRIVQSLGDANVLFMGNHGVTVCAPTVAEALLAVVRLEHASNEAILALSGAPMSSVDTVPQATAQEWFEEQCRLAPSPVGQGSRRHYWAGRGGFAAPAHDPCDDLVVAARALAHTGLVPSHASNRFSMDTPEGARYVEGDFNEASATVAVEATPAAARLTARARLLAALGKSSPLRRIERLLPISQDAMLMSDHVAFVPDAGAAEVEEALRGDETRVVVGADSIGIRGNSPGHVLALLERLDKAAEIQVLATSTGRPLRYVAPEVVAQPRNAFLCKTADERPHTPQLQLEWYKRMLAGGGTEGQGLVESSATARL